MLNRYSATGTEESTKLYVKKIMVCSDLKEPLKNKQQTLFPDKGNITFGCWLCVKNISPAR